MCRWFLAIFCFLVAASANDSVYNIYNCGVYRNINETENSGQLLFKNWNQPGESLTAKVSAEQIFYTDYPTPQTHRVPLGVQYWGVNYTPGFEIEDVSVWDFFITVEAASGFTMSYRVRFDFDACPYNYRIEQQEILFNVPYANQPRSCQLPDTSECVISDESQYDYQCLNGGCLKLSLYQDSNCAKLYPRSYFGNSLRTNDNGGVIAAFRLMDCQGAAVSSLTLDQIVVTENLRAVSATNTQQKLELITGQKTFIQLMIGMCPSTFDIIEELIEALHYFKYNLAFDGSTYIALTVFDGARGYVDLLSFTNSVNSFSRAIDALRTYQSRDFSCNVYESVSAKYTELGTHLYGQPWDNVHYVVFSPSADLTQYAPAWAMQILGPLIELNSVVRPHLIGYQSSWIQQNDFTVNVAQTTAELIDAFISTARVISTELDNDYLFGYCSPARAGFVQAGIDLVLPDSGRTTNIFSLDYTADNFGGCSANLDYCSPCTTAIARSTALCHTCFTASSQETGVQDLLFFRGLLRCPDEGTNDCALQLATANLGADPIRFDLYIRKGDISNPLLYDYKFMDLSSADAAVYLPFISANDLVGVYVQWRNLTAELIGVTVALVPTTATPDSAPIDSPYAEPPLKYSPPLENQPSVGVPSGVVSLGNVPVAFCFIFNVAVLLLL